MSFGVQQRRRKWWWSWLGVCAACAGVCTTTSAARAYELKEPVEGSVVHWRAPRVVIRLGRVAHEELTGEAVLGSLVMATDAWRGIHGAPDVVIQGGAPAEPDPTDRINSVHVMDPWPSELPEYLAVTVSTYDLAGRLLDTDILINGEMPYGVLDERDPANRFDLPSVLTHEIGHVLGLDESNVPEATMYGFLRRGQVHQRTLHEDDELGMRALYGVAPGQESTQALSCDATGQAPTGWLFIALWMLCLLPRKRRKPVSIRRR